MTTKITFLITIISLVASCSLKEKLSEYPTPTLPAQPMAVQPVKALTWGYKGLNGPENWSQLSPSFSACSQGQSQSPINLVWSRPMGNADLKFQFNPGPAQVSDTGNTIMVNVSPGNLTFIRGESFELKSVLFHSSSEHTLSGNSLPLEVQLIHQNTAGQIAIIAFFAIEGPRNTLIDSIWSNIPQTKGIEQVINSHINFSELLPSKYSHYHYMGSLTTPPCSEGVSWNILNTPITMSRDQILSFRQIYPHNNRPIQKLNNRKVTNY